MKATLNRKSLLAALTMVSAVVPRKATLPILQAVRLRASGDSLEASGTNLDQALAVTVKAAAEGEALTTLKPLKDFLARSTEEEVTLEVVPRRVVMEDDPSPVKILRARCGLSTFEGDHFPSEDAVPYPTLCDPLTMATSASMLRNALRLTRYAQSQDASRYVLNGICMEHEPEIGKTSLIATDGQRLAIGTLHLHQGPGKKLSVIIPTDAVDVLSKLIAKSQDEVIMCVQPASITADKEGETACEAKIVFQLGSATLHSKLIDGNFPNYKQVIPTWEPKFIFNFDREKLIAAMKATKIAPKNNEKAMRMEFLKGTLQLSQEFEETKSENSMVYTGSSRNHARGLVTAFNPRYVIEALESLSGARVALNFIDELTPATIHSSSDGDQTIVIMPMRNI